jgi:hypothetical protein
MSLSEIDPVRIRTYISGSEAHLAKSVLQQHGLRCAITGDQISDTLSVYGNVVAKVELCVDAANAEEAAAILAEHEAGATADRRWDTTDGMLWRCPGCDELNGQSFDECWSCARARPEDAELVWEQGDPFSVDGTAPPPLPDVEDPSPYRVPQEQSAAVEVRPNNDHSQDLSRRAFRACLFAWFAPIPLAPYSLYLILRCFHEGRVNGRVWVALILSLPALAVSVFVVIAALRFLFVLVSDTLP